MPGFQSSGRLSESLERLQQPTWCSGCGKQHPLLFFSAVQRGIASAHRICIGREGSIRVCAHEAVTWPDVEAANAKAPEASTANRTVKKCRDASHRPMHVPGWQCKPKFTLFASLPTDALVHWTNPAFDIDPTVPIKKEHIRDYLTARKQIFGHALCPHVELGDGQLLLPFEHNQCVCFEATQAGDAVSSRPYEPLSHSCGIYPWEQCCRCIAVKKPSQGGCFSSSNKYSRVLEDDCHHYICAECSTSYSWIRDTLNRVYLRISRHICLKEGPSSLGWLSGMDPESYGIAQDEQLRHVAWCVDAQCSTRSRWSRLLYLLRRTEKEQERRDRHAAMDSSQRLFQEWYDVRAATERSEKLQQLETWTAASDATGSNALLQPTGGLLPRQKGNWGNAPPFEGPVQP